MELQWAVPSKLPVLSLSCTSAKVWRVDGRDLYLQVYHALCGESAVIIPAAPCYRYRLMISQHEWESIRDAHFATSDDENIYMVTEIWATHKFAFDHRNSIDDDFYVVNVRDVGGYEGIAPDFTIRQTSDTLRESPPGNQIPYTIFASTLLVQRLPLRNHGIWSAFST